MKPSMMWQGVFVVFFLSNYEPSLPKYLGYVPIYVLCSSLFRSYAPVVNREI
jgi:hypothetical protein